MKNLLNKINNYWFKPGFIKDLSIIRIVSIGLQLYFLLFTHVLLLQKSLTLLNAEYKPAWALKILLFPLGWEVRPSFMVLQALWFGAVITGFTSLLGIYKRISLFILAAFSTILITHAYAYSTVNHIEAILIIFLWILAFGDSSKTWGFDDLRRRIVLSKSKMKFEPRNIDAVDSYVRWPVLLMQWAFCLIYVSAGIEKIKGGFNFYSLMYYFSETIIWAGPNSIGIFLSHYPIILNILVAFTFAFELTFILVMFFPGITWLYILNGIGFHASIQIIMGPIFLYWGILYIIFIEPLRESWDKLLALLKIKKTETKKLNLIFDGSCASCLRNLVLINYFDIRRKLEYHNSETVLNLDNLKIKKIDVENSLILLTHEKQMYKGFDLFKKLTTILPILYILIPIVYFPFADKAVEAVYSFWNKRYKGKFGT